MTEWRTSPLAPPHVLVSACGQVRTADRVAPSSRAAQPTQIRAGRILSPYISRVGYPTVAVKVGPKRTKYSVHRLVASAFCDGFDPSLSVNHINGVKTDNRADNLEWVSLNENTALAWTTGQCQNFGDKCTFPRKLSDADVARIRERLAGGDAPLEIATHYGVTRDMIYAIKSGKRRARTQVIHPNQPPSV